MKGLIKSVAILFIAALNAIFLLIALDIFSSVAPNVFQTLVSKITWVNLLQSTLWNWATSGNKIEILLALSTLYFCIGVLSWIAGSLGYFRTFKPAHEKISHIVHLAFWPIAIFWHWKFYFIFRQLSLNVAFDQHIAYKRIMWAYWASIKYYYGFWVLSVIFVIVAFVV